MSSNLSNDVITVIQCYLSYKDLVSVCSSNKLYQCDYNDPIFWKTLLRNKCKYISDQPKTNPITDLYRLKYMNTFQEVYLNKIKDIKRYAQTIEFPLGIYGRDLESDIQYLPNMKTAQIGLMRDQVILEQLQTPHAGRSYSVVVQGLPGKLIKGIKFSNDFNLKMIRLTFGGQTIDEIYSESFDALRKIYDMDGEIPFHINKIGIPYLNWHQIRIEYEYKDAGYIDSNTHNMEITYYDIPLPKLWTDITLLSFEVNYRAEHIKENSINYTQNYTLKLNKKVYYIIIYAPDIEVHNALLVFDDELLLLKKTHQINGNNIYALTRDLTYDSFEVYGIDFHRIGDVNLFFEIDNIDNIDKIKVSTVMMYGLKITNGMAGKL